MNEFILGIDDAGRGPVIGPMVLAGCLIDSSNEKELRRLGVKDSKQITPKRRTFLVEKIKEISETFEVIRVLPPEIDEMGPDGNKRIKLNEIEAKACAEIINRINKGYKKIKIIIDCPSTNISKWKDYLLTKIDNLSNLAISCEHKADVNHISVSAASIIAKDIREKEMDKIRERYVEEIGSGYCSDPLTMKFIEKYAVKYQDDGIFRRTWITWKKASLNFEQSKLI
jgi:ribonuclease HII